MRAQCRVSARKRHDVRPPPLRGDETAIVTIGPDGVADILIGSAFILGRTT